MQRLAAEELACKKYPCIVCLLETNSVQELHEHQKFFHTTEELSFSVICLVNFMCLNNAALGLNLTSECPLFWQSYRINYPISKSCNQPHTTGRNNCVVHNPAPYASGKNHETQSLLGDTKIDKIYEQGNFASQYCLIPSEGLGKKKETLFDTNLEDTGSNTPVLSSLELELSTVHEISDETFLNCINGICKDLEVIGRLGVRGRQSGSKSADQMNRGLKRNGKTQTHSHTKIIQGLKKMKSKGLQRSQTLLSLQ